MSDYKALLIKYMALVMDNESISYVEDDGPVIRLTEAERTALLEIEAQASEQYPL